MKKPTTLIITLLVFLAAGAPVFSQFINCEEMMGSHGDLDVFNEEQPINVSILDVAISGASTALPTFEYALSDPNLIVGEGVQEGFEVIAASPTGTFNLSGLGFAIGDTLCLNGVFYDLPNLKEIMDDLFNGVLIGQPCCGLMEVLLSEDICQNLNDAGINSPDDVNSLDDVIVSLGAFGAPASIEGVLDIIDNTFNALAGAPAECAGNLPICYSITSRECLTVGPEIIVGIQDLSSNLQDFALLPNPVAGQNILVKLESKSNQQATLRIHDMTGRLLSTKTVDLVSGINEFDLPVVEFYPGNYLLSVQIADQVINKTFVKQ